MNKYKTLALYVLLPIMVGCTEESNFADEHVKFEEAKEVFFKTNVRSNETLLKARIIAFDTKDKMKCISNTGMVHLSDADAPLIFKTYTGTHHFFALVNETESIAEQLMGEKYKNDSLSVQYDTFTKSPLTKEQLVGADNDTLMVCKVSYATVRATDSSFADLVINGETKSQLNLKVERLLTRLVFVITPVEAITTFEVQSLKLTKIPKYATIEPSPTSDYLLNQDITILKDASSKSWKGNLVIPEHIAATPGDSLVAVIKAKVGDVNKEYKLGLNLSSDNPMNPTLGTKYYNHDRNTEYQYNITVKENRPVDVETTVHNWDIVNVDAPILGTYLDIDKKKLLVPIGGSAININSNAEKIRIDWSNAAPLIMVGHEGVTNEEFALKDSVGTYLFRWKVLPDDSYNGYLVVTAGNVQKRLPVGRVEEKLPFEMLTITPAPGSKIPKEGIKVTVTAKSTVLWYVGELLTDDITSKDPTLDPDEIVSCEYTIPPYTMWHDISVMVGYLRPAYRLYEYYTYYYDLD